jgi:hypothetical protein
MEKMMNQTRDMVSTRTDSSSTNPPLPVVLTTSIGEEDFMRCLRGGGVEALVRPQLGSPREDDSSGVVLC